MHKIVVLAALLLALPAAKPVPPDEPPGGAATQLTSQAWRERGVPICVSRLRAIREFTPDDLETICGCTFDSYLQGHGTNPLPVPVKSGPPARTLVRISWATPSPNAL